MHERTRECAAHAAAHAIDEAELGAFDGLFADASHQRDDQQAQHDHERPHDSAREALTQVGEGGGETRRDSRCERARDRDRGHDTEQAHELPPQSAARADEGEIEDDRETEDVEPAHVERSQARREIFHAPHWSGRRASVQRRATAHGGPAGILAPNALESQPGDAPRMPIAGATSTLRNPRAKGYTLRLEQQRMSTERDPLDVRFEALERALREDTELAREFLESQREFFHGHYDAARVDRDETARRRHLEWFLVERVSPSFERLAVEHLAQHHAVRTGLDDPVQLLTLVHSHAGVFEVTGADEATGVWLRDLASNGEYPVVDPSAAHVLHKGDLVAGRIFPTTDSGYRISRAAAIHRNSTLLDALRADLERARATRRGVMRLGQREIEGMFFADLAPESGDPVGDARGLLLEAGIERDEIEAWFEVLAETPFRRDRIVVGVDDALGPILDRLAFETGSDLDSARRALVRAWEHLSVAGPGRGPSLRPVPKRAAESPADVARALAALEEKRRQGAPLDQAFDELEAELALDDDDEADADPLAPDFPGGVAAVITEFLWETELTAGPERARELVRIESLGRFARDIGAFENLSVRDLLAYTSWWLPESNELESGDAAHSTLAALSNFCRWADETQQVDLHAQFHETLTALTHSLPRVIEANKRRTRAADPSQGELFEIAGIRGGAARLRDRGQSEREAAIEPDLAAWLRAGDRVRAEIHADGRVAIYCCYPPEARGLETSMRARSDAYDSDDE